jgi:hypothetical protein
MQEWSPDGVRQERTEWRDQAISARHRMWGFNCPCVDLDFLVAEYNVGKPVALIDYKHFLAKPPLLDHATYRALADLADGYKDTPLPFFIAFYWPDIWAFRLIPVNDCAKPLCRGRVLCERDYVKGLYFLRDRVRDFHLVEATLNTQLPDVAA